MASGLPFPSAPNTLTTSFRAPVAGLLLPGAIIDRRGHTIVATAEGDVLAVSPSGTVQTVATLDEPLPHGPVAIGGGRFVLAGTKTALFAGGAGVSGLSPIAVTGGRWPNVPGGGPPLAPVADGADGVWLVRGARWLHVSSGQVLADGVLEAPPAVLSSLGPAGAAVVDGQGALRRLGVAGRPLVMPGSRVIADVVPLGPGRVLLVCSDGAVATADLDTGKTTLTELPRAAGTPLARGDHGVAYVDATNNLVLVDRATTVVAVAPLRSRSVELVALAGGEIGIAFGTGELQIVDAAGNVRLEGKGCDSPVALLADVGRLVVVCRDGHVVAAGDKAP